MRTENLLSSPRITNYFAYLPRCEEGKRRNIIHLPVQNGAIDFTCFESLGCGETSTVYRGVLVDVGDGDVTSVQHGPIVSESNFQPVFEVDSLFLIRF